jgi:hypothetical protein
LKKKENHFNSASRKEKTEEKKKMCVINCYDCPDCPGLQKLPTKENYFSKSDNTTLKPVSAWSREAVRRWDANLLMDRLLNSKAHTKVVGKINCTHSSCRRWRYDPALGLLKEKGAYSLKCKNGLCFVLKGTEETHCAKHYPILEMYKKTPVVFSKNIVTTEDFLDFIVKL